MSRVYAPADYYDDSEDEDYDGFSFGSTNYDKPVN